MLNFFKNYKNYEYATKDSRHLAASLFFHALQYSLIATLGLAVVMYFAKPLFIMGVW